MLWFEIEVGRWGGGDAKGGEELTKGAEPRPHKGGMEGRGLSAADRCRSFFLFIFASGLEI